MDERCFECAELYHGCNATPENPAAHCADRLRLPDAMRGTCGQTFPPSRMQDRTEPRIRLVAAAPVQVQAQSKNSPASRPARAPALRKPAAPRIGPRLGGCGAILPKGKRLCDACRTESRRQTKRGYMRSYMEQRHSPTSGSDPGVPFPGPATHATHVSGEDRRSAGLRGGGPPDSANFCTNRRRSVGVSPW